MRSGLAPSGAIPDRFPGGMKETGPLTAPVVPGIVRGLEEFHRRFGSLPWRTLFDDAIDLADQGHPVSKVLTEQIPAHYRDLAADPGCAALYLPNGRALACGETLGNPRWREHCNVSPIWGTTASISRRYCRELNRRSFRGAWRAISEAITLRATVRCGSSLRRTESAGIVSLSCRRILTASCCSCSSTDAAALDSRVLGM